jgi:hypothetical protein
MRLVSKIGDLIGLIAAAVCFVLCFVVTAPIAIVKVAVGSFRKYFDRMCSAYTGNKE